jgi:CBS domain-containing protein
LNSDKRVLTVIDVAETSFISLDENTLVADAAKSLYERESDTIIVTRNDAKSGVRIPVGIVTQRDLIFRVVAQNKGPFKANIGSIMSAPVIVIQREAPLQEALEIMKQNKFSRLPVVTNSGDIIGLITMKMLVQKASLGRKSEANSETS